MHRARKRFGQNFLHDQHIIQRIGNSTGVTAADHVVEIGPGRGALTDVLLATGAKVTAIELDRDLLPILRAQFFNADNFTVIEGDALRFDFGTLATAEHPIKLVGNLPYNISTPLIFHLLEHRNHIIDMHFMLQKEVVDRLCAEPGTGAYSKLTVMAQYYCRPSWLFNVPPGAFTPQPKVDSAIVRLVPRPADELTAADARLLSRLVRTAFSQRRKTIRNNLKNDFDIALLEQAGIDEGARPEVIPVGDYVRLSNLIAEASV